MATSIALPREQSSNLAQQFFRLVPGVLLLAGIGYAGKILEKSINTYAKAHHLTIPNIEYVLWAIAIGLLISNVLTIPSIFQPGIATYEFWLKAGIVLLGSRFVVGDVLKLGGISLGLVVVEITGSLLLMTLLGRIFKLKPKLTSLLAVGSAVCGVSAIIAAKGAIDADDEDSSFAIAAILALGAIALFSFPLIGHTAAHERFIVRNLGRPRRRQHRRSDGRRCPLLGYGGKVGRPRQNDTQCDDWICSAGVCVLLGTTGTGPGCNQQGSFSFGRNSPSSSLGSLRSLCS